MVPKKRLKTVESKNEEVELEDIGNSTSSFGKNAEKFLNININNTDDFDDIINHNVANNQRITYNQDDINAELKDLFLKDFNRDEIRVYKPQQHKNLSKNAQVFLYKLSTVINNNYQIVEPPHVEAYIHDLMEKVLREAKFEDGTELVLMPCQLKLSIGDEEYAARADREGRRGTEIIWVLDEDKHRFDKRWKKGDIQLIANMIAAAQTNRSIINKVYPERIIGIKFEADCLYFYSAYVTEKYLDELFTTKKQDTILSVNKFPRSKELSLSLYVDRQDIFLYLCALRKYALNLEPIYVN